MRVCVGGKGPVCLCGEGTVCLCVWPARAPVREVLLILGLDGVRGQPVSCTYQGKHMTDSKVRMRDLSDCEFSVSFAQRSAFIKVVRFDIGASRCCF